MASGAVTVIPWGFGKWLGSRGRRVAERLESADPRSLFLGDNGGRLAIAGMPSLLRAGQQGGFRILPGTDPFPLKGGYRRVGRFGFLAGVEPSSDHPWRDLRRWLMRQDQSPSPFGRASGLLEFVSSQVGIQIHNWLWRPS